MDGSIYLQVWVDSELVWDSGFVDEYWQNYQTGTFEISSGYHTIQFLATGADEFAYAFFDNITLYADAGASPYSITVPNPSFEDHDLSALDTDYEFVPTYMAGPQWNFSGNTGISKNGSDFNHANAPSGSQVAFLQTLSSSGGTIERGTYSMSGYQYVSLQAAQRSGNSADQSIHVYVDSEHVATITPTGTSFATYTTDPFYVSPGWHTYKLVTGNTTASDSTAFVDDVNWYWTNKGDRTNKGDSSGTNKGDSSEIAHM